MTSSYSLLQQSREILKEIYSVIQGHTLRLRRSSALFVRHSTCHEWVARNNTTALLFTNEFRQPSVLFVWTSCDVGRIVNWASAILWDLWRRVTTYKTKQFTRTKTQQRNILLATWDCILMRSETMNQTENKLVRNVWRQEWWHPPTSINSLPCVKYKMVPTKLLS